MLESRFTIAVIPHRGAAMGRRADAFQQTGSICARQESRLPGVFWYVPILLILLTGCSDGPPPVAYTKTTVNNTQSDKLSSPLASSQKLPSTDPEPEMDAEQLARRQRVLNTKALRMRGDSGGGGKGAAGVIDLSFDDLEFQIERDAEFEPAMIGDEIRQLEGKQVVIRGFILGASVFQQKGIKTFVLVRDNQQCCFGPGAYLYHNLQVEMTGDATADFSIRPVALEGTLSIRPWIGPDDRCYSVYHVTGTRVR